MTPKTNSGREFKELMEGLFYPEEPKEEQEETEEEEEET